MAFHASVQNIHFPLQLTLTRTHHSTHINFEFSRCQVWMTGSSSCKIWLMLTRNVLVIKWRNLGRQFPLHLTSSLKMSSIYSISIKFPPRTMMLKMMEFCESPSQHPKPSLPSLTHKVFKNQHSLSRWPIFTNSCPNLGIFLQQQVSMVLPKINFWQFPSQPPTTTFPSLKHHALETQNRWSR